MTDNDMTYQCTQFAELCDNQVDLVSENAAMDVSVEAFHTHGSLKIAKQCCLV